VRPVWGAVKTFYVKAYRDNLTGLSGMVAYNLMLSLFPLALLALFIASRVLRSETLQQTVIDGLKHILPRTGESAIHAALERVKSASLGLGAFAALTSLWFGSSFWGAVDTAFCRIYEVKCRSWVQQKRFSLAMVIVVLLLMAATVVVPAVQSILVKGASDLPFGLAHVKVIVFGLTLAVTLVVLFLIFCLIYWVVPNRPVTWRGVWPGALLATLAIGIIDYGFPLYLSNVSTIARLGTTLIFITIILLWFYALAIIILGGAIVNWTRLEPYENDAS
jgi:membrane protein